MVRAFGLAGLIAVALSAASPVLAQTANTAKPGANDQSDAPLAQRDCSEREIAAGIDGCKPQNGPGGFAVILPDILVDLFPFGDGSNPRGPGGDDFAVDDGGRQTGTPPLPTPDPRRPGWDGSDELRGTVADSTPPGESGATTPPAPPSSGVNPPRSPPPPAIPPVAISGAFVPDEVLVTLEGDGAAAQDIATTFGLDIRSQRTSTLLGATIVRYGIPDGRPVGIVLAQLAGDPRTLTRVANSVFDLQQVAGVVNYAFQHISLDSEAATGTDVRVAVIDTAVDETHPALAGVIAKIHDAMPDTPVVVRDHGTSVDGLIAGVGPFKGMAPGAMIYHARAFENGKSTMNIIIEAFDWAANEDVRIVNMSFVGPKNELMEMACANARARGMILVAAAGNNGPGAPWGYPAAYNGVIAVTATDERDEIMQQANRGPYVFVSAPGVDMVAPIGGGSDLVTGTSFAAAIVSGAIANLLHEFPDRSADWVEQALSQTATDLGKAGRDSDFGYGLINTKAARAIRQ